MSTSQIKLICFDLNKTLIKENSWLNLNLAMGVTQEEDDELMRQYESGEISYEAANKVLLNIYQTRGKATRENILSAISKYTYLPGAKDLVAYLKSKGYIIVLITGSMDILANKVAKELNIEFTAANNIFVFDTENYLKDIKMIGDDAEAKLHHLREFAKQSGTDLSQCICVGDGDNDKLLFEATGKGVTFTGSKIESSAWKIIEDLDEIRNLL